MTNETLQQATQRLIDRDIYCNQSMLVDAAFKNEFFQYDDINNIIHGDTTCPTYGEPVLPNEDGNCSLCDEPMDESREVFEWYLVSDWLAEKLEEVGAVVLINDYGTWWGRTCTGQAISMDGTEIEAIAKKYLL